jgi:probable phosphoglycerate mutase
MSKFSKLIIEADGGSRGNPGPAGSGAVVINGDTGEVLIEVAKFIGTATNNVAEYTALMAGLSQALQLNSEANILVRMDSKLVIEQMTGSWKIKHPDMIKLAADTQKLANGRNITWTWIPREQNSRADALANKAMDEEIDSITSFVGHKAAAAAVAEFNQAGPSSVRAPGGVTEPQTTLVLVRHGRTHLTETKKISGSGGENPNLSDLGREDARKVAVEIKALGNPGPWSHLAPVSEIVSSPLQRTLDTAHIIANELRLSVSVNDKLAEISFGDWDGHTNDEVKQKWPSEFSAWQGSWDTSPPKGESLEQFDKRILQGLGELLEQHKGKTIAVVAHVMPIRGIARRAMETGISGYWVPQIAPCSITIIRFWGDQAAELVCLNSTRHL